MYVVGGSCVVCDLVCNPSDVASHIGRIGQELRLITVKT
jgi:hypothetical protein